MRTATVLRPDVRVWMRSHPEAAELFLDELRQLWQTEIPSSYEELVRGATLAQNEHWNRRTLYVRGLDEVFDPAWRIPAQLVDRADLIRRAIADPLRLWTLALWFVPGNDRDKARRFVEQALSWFVDLRQAECVWLELRKGRKRLTAQLFTPEGRRAAG